MCLLQGPRAWGRWSQYGESLEFHWRPWGVLEEEKRQEQDLLVQMKRRGRWGFQHHPRILQRTGIPQPTQEEHPPVLDPSWLEVLSLVDRPWSCPR